MPLKLAYYADDFTGATDALEALTVAGVETELFTSVPTRNELEARHPHLEAIGVAGLTRATPVSELEREVPGTFELLRQLDATLVHYKVCSTFDSSPEIGSIGRVADIGLRVFESSYAPVLVGAPDLGRYVVFGNLFASDGVTVHRLDRHATMRDHPVTPMVESDLRRHLGAQTEKTIGLVDLMTIRNGSVEVRRSLNEQVREGAELILFDTLDSENLAILGKQMWESALDDNARFVIGSSGVERALTRNWQIHGELQTPVWSPLPVRPVDRIVVLSASASVTTAQQIEWASDTGWGTIAIDCARLIDDTTATTVIRGLIKDARQAYESGRSVILFTTLGSTDPSLETTRERATELGYDATELGNEIGRRLGQLLTELVRQLRPRRVCVAGGDTSGHVVRQMGVRSLRMISATVPGAPLCKVSAPDPALNSLELVLKGGQTGPPSFFETVRTAGSG